MGRRAAERGCEGLDLAERDARRAAPRERALGFAQVALEAARCGDGARMARCLEIAQRERRRLRLADQVAVLDRLARAAIAVDAPGFARLLSGLAADCTRRVRRRDARAAALAVCDALAESLGRGDGIGPRLVFAQPQRRPQFHDPSRETPSAMRSCA